MTTQDVDGATGKASEQGCFDAIDAIYDHVINKLHREPGKLILWRKIDWALEVLPCTSLQKKKIGGLRLETPFLSAFRSATGFTMSSVGSVQEMSSYH